MIMMVKLVKYWSNREAGNHHEWGRARDSAGNRDRKDPIAESN